MADRPSPPPRLLLFLALAAACDLSQLGIVTDPEPDAGQVVLRPDPGGPEPGPVERCDAVATSIAYAEADPGYASFDGEATLLDGTWSARLEPEDAPHTLEVAFAPPESPATSTWLWEFSSRRIGETLRAITYPGAMANPAIDQRFPELEVTSETRTCGGATGTFRIHELVYANRRLTSFLASFEQRCGPVAMRGCVRYVADR